METVEPTPTTEVVNVVEPSATINYGPRLPDDPPAVAAVVPIIEGSR